MEVRIANYDSVMTSEEKEEIEKALSFILSNKEQFATNGIVVAKKLNYDLLEKIFLNLANPKKT